MSFIKLQGQFLFDGETIQKDQVLILRPDGTVEDLVSENEAGIGIRRVEGLLSPGFINCHCHLELSHMKGMIEEHTGLLAFVRQIVAKRQQHAEGIQLAIQEAEAQMMENGIVAVGDISNTIDSLAVKAQAKMYYHNFIEVIGFNPSQAAENLAAYQAIYNQFVGVFPAQQVSLTPHAPYSVSQPLWELMAREDKSPIFSIHNQETAEENEWFIQKTGGFEAMYQRLGLGPTAFTASGKTSIQTYLDYFLPHQSLMMIHNVFTSAADIQFAQSRFPQISWCLCPNANYYIGHQLPDIDMLQTQAHNIVLGTDSLASNYGLSIWDEILRIQQNFPHISLETLLRWATSNGAKALKIADRFGRFKKGMNPGVVLIQENQARKLEIG